tara:strand:+ start:1063 stop:1566 length:504 start_codon:yes stop_codon:yes gene_type:complete
MSTILVDTINERTSGNGVSIDGHIINYKRHFFSVTSTQQQTSDSYSDVTGSSFTFTPLTSASTIYMIFSGNCRGFAPSGQDMIAYVRPHFNGAAGNAFILQADNLGKLGDTVFFPFFFCIAQQINAADHTTSAITMKLQIRAGSTGQNMEFVANQSHLATDVFEVAP